MQDHEAHTAPYWDAARRRKLMLPRCDECGKVHFYPRSRCPFCMSKELRWVESDGNGKVYSYTLVHRALNPADANRLPFVIAIVEVMTVHMMARITGDDAGLVRIGDSVRFIFDPTMGEDGLPAFTTATG